MLTWTLYDYLLTVNANMDVLYNYLLTVNANMDII